MWGSVLLSTSGFMSLVQCLCPSRTRSAPLRPTQGLWQVCTPVHLIGLCLAVLQTVSEPSTCWFPGFHLSFSDALCAVVLLGALVPRSAGTTKVTVVTSAPWVCGWPVGSSPIWKLKRETESSSFTSPDSSVSLQVDKAKWGIYESTLLFPKQLDFFKKRSFDSKELGAGSEFGWEARAVGERKGGDARVPGLPCA